MLPRLIFFLSGFILAGLLGFFIIQYAKGVRFDLKKLNFSKTGILVATSNPDGAQVFINGKLKTATNQTIDIVPDTYDIQISKEGYFPWQKRLTIKEETVTKTDAILFPKAPSLSPITFDAAKEPFLSPDGTKLAWIVPSSPNTSIKSGVWILELANLPFGFARNARQVTDADFSGAKLTWSPDGRTILVEKEKTAFLLEAGSFTKQPELIVQKPIKVNQTKSLWLKEIENETKSKIEKLPSVLQDIIQRKTSQFAFSPNENKVIYTVSGDSTIPENLIPKLPGSSTQKQERDIKTGRTYVYDIKEDRNFLITEDSQSLIVNHYSSINNPTRKLEWLSTSHHLLFAEPGKITILEYDGTNKVVMWSGSFEAPFAFTTPDNSQLIILTTLGAANGATNLYTISLK